VAAGASQTAGGAHGEWIGRGLSNQPINANNGSAGVGGSGVLDNANAFSAAGGGGGWFGGGGGVSGAGGGGGSSHIDNVVSGFGITARTIGGSQLMPTHNGENTMTGNQGNGFARITRLNTEPSIQKIEITLNGESEMTILVGESFTDLGAILTRNGQNISYRLTVTGAVNTNVAGQYIITYSYTSTETSQTYTVTRTVNVINAITNFNFTGMAQIFTAPVTGQYRLEVWGASGGNNLAANTGGRGGYSTGVVTLTAGQTVFVYAGRERCYIWSRNRRIRRV